MSIQKWYGLGLLLVVATLNWLLLRHVILDGQQLLDIQDRVMLFGNHLFTLVSGSFSLIAFLLFAWEKRGWSIASTIIATLAWILWSVIVTHFKYGFINSLPFLLYNFMFTYYLIKNRKTNQNQNI